jgi:hypothetical protein
VGEVRAKTDASFLVAEHIESMISVVEKIAYDVSDVYGHGDGHGQPDGHTKPGRSYLV